MKGDEIERLFLQYYNDALLYTLTLCKDKSTAEDIVSEAFFKALESEDGSILNFKYWLLRVCKNLYFNSHRRQRKHTELNEEQASDREQVLDKIIQDSEYQSLYRVIELLPDNQKEVLTLFYYEEMTINNIADMIGKSVTNTKVILYRARENLRKLLEE